MDFGADGGPHSYSAIIEFEDRSIPGDPAKMSDAQFINLASIAYDEMILLWANAQLNARDCPGAMIAMESAGRIYFASSIRSANGKKWNEVDSQIQGSIGWYQDQCLRSSIGAHRYRGACGEPNVLRLYGDTFPPIGDPPRYQAPPTTDTSPRIVAFLIQDSTADPWTTPGASAVPCRDTRDRGYGCTRFVEQYKLKPIQPQDPDKTGDNDWAFTKVQNPRTSCPSGGISSGSGPGNVTNAASRAISRGLLS
ncbi:MAG: hypothetical protein M1821_010054 [Bathelium mastoideum]|nr:MAG: hypothetical protein M1821_010054 [Bathelium mastoideum]